MSILNVLLNVLWIIFGGLLSALCWMLAGVLCCITVVGIPVGLQCFKFAKLILMPFGKKVYFGNMSSGKAAGIGVFIVNPDVQSHLFSFIDGITVEGIPFVRHIFRDHARTGMDKRTSAACIFKVFQHTVDFNFCNFSVPNHKRGCTVLG